MAVMAQTSSSVPYVCWSAHLHCAVHKRLNAAEQFSVKCICFRTELVLGR